jgi:G3E family GTPase
MSSLDKTDSKVPVLTVCGWLGAGKTTLLEHLLKTASGMRIGVLVNDMAAVNVDANTLARVVHAKEEMIEFSNGAATWQRLCS